MYKIVNTTNIQTFDCRVTIDVLNRIFRFDFSNTEFKNGVSNINVGLAVSLEDSSGIKLSEIDWNNPQIPDVSISLVYELDLSTFVDWHFLFQKYKIKVGAKDETDFVYLDFPIKEICQPKDFTENGYSYGSFELLFNCNNNNVLVKETTNFSYKDKEPFEKDTIGTLYYPQGTKPQVDFTFTPFVDTNIYTGIYKLDNTTYATYDFDDGFYIKLAFSTVINKEVTCEQPMQELLCCITDLQIEKEKHCGDAIGRALEERWAKASLPFFVGIMKEISGQDSSFEAKKVREILRCSCTKTKIKKVQQSMPLNYNINVVQGGATTVVQSISGTTKTFTVSSKSYVLVKNNNSDTAFTIHPIDTTTPNVVKIPISFNYEIMAASIYNATANSEELLTQLNSLIQSTGIDLSNIDGKCVIDISATNYFLSQRFSNSSVSISKILIGNTEYDAPTLLTISNTNGIENWLNSLGQGSFTVSFSTSLNNGVYINILSINNTNQIVSAVFATNNGEINVVFQRTNKSVIALFQALIDWACELTTEQVKLGRYFTLYSINLSNQIVATTYPPNTILADFLENQQSVLQDYANRIKNYTQITCDTIKNLFPQSVQTLQNTDYIIGVKGGICARIFPVEFGTRMLQLGITDAAFTNAFCALVDACRNGRICTPYSQFFATLVDFDDDEFEMEVVFNNSQAISHDISYARIDLGGIINYVTYTGITSSPYNIPVKIPKGQYNVRIKPNYTDGRICSPSEFITPSCGTITAFSAEIVLDAGNYYIDVDYAATSDKVKININYPNGGLVTQIFNNGDPIYIQIPNNIFGNFTVTMQAVCCEETNWLSTPTAPVILLKENQSGRVVVINDTIGTSIVNVNGLSGFGTGGIIVFPSARVEGVHGVSNANICVEVDLEVSNQVFELYINGLLQETVIAATIGLHCTSSVYNILASDFIVIVLKQES